MRVPDVLVSLTDQGVIDDVIRPLKSGKEAQVYLVEVDGHERVAKVYKDAQHRSFKQRAQYTEGRRVRNTRDQRAIDRRTRYGRAQQEEAWKSAEVDVIYRLHAHGIRVPTPYNFIDGVLIMELMCDEGGEPAPRLSELSLDRDVARAYFDQLLREVVKMLSAGIVHGDLSEHNVLVDAQGPVIIDFPQAVEASQNRNARQLLLRDVDNLGQFLARCVPGARRMPYGQELWAAFESNRLTPDLELKGQFQRSDRSTNMSALLDEIAYAEQDEQRRRQAAGEPGPRPRKREVIIEPVGGARDGRRGQDGGRRDGRGQAGARGDGRGQGGPRQGGPRGDGRRQGDSRQGSGDARQGGGRGDSRQGGPRGDGRGQGDSRQGSGDSRQGGGRGDSRQGGPRGDGRGQGDSRQGSADSRQGGRGDSRQGGPRGDGRGQGDSRQGSGDSRQGGGRGDSRQGGPRGDGRRHGGEGRRQGDPRSDGPRSGGEGRRQSDRDLRAGPPREGRRADGGPPEERRDGPRRQEEQRQARPGEQSEGAPKRRRRRRRGGGSGQPQSDQPRSGTARNDQPNAQPANASAPSPRESGTEAGEAEPRRRRRRRRGGGGGEGDRAGGPVSEGGAE